MNPHDAAHQLAKSIKESEEYHNFIKAYNELKNDSTASNIFNDFRQLQMEVQEEQAKGNEISSEKEEQLQKLSQSATYNQIVKNFIEAEYRFANIIKDVQQIIADAIDIGE